MNIKITPDTDPVNKEDGDDKGVCYHIGFENVSASFAFGLGGYLYKPNERIRYLSFSEVMITNSPHIAKSSILIKVGVRCYNGIIVKPLQEGVDTFPELFQKYLNGQDKIVKNGNT